MRSVEQARVARPRLGTRRTFTGTLRAGWLRVHRGCWVVVVDENGDRVEHKRDASARLRASHYQVLISSTDVVANPLCVALTEILDVKLAGWDEDWRVVQRSSDGVVVPDGSVFVNELPRWARRAA